MKHDERKIVPSLKPITLIFNFSSAFLFSDKQLFTGKNYCDEWYEWARQVRRWTIGAAEVFHYFAIKFFRLPAMVSFSFACKFVFYYGFLLCIASVYTIVAPSVVSF